MKIGIISDIHCNVGSLRKGLELMKPVDMILCAGDLVFQYRFSNEVIDVLIENNVCTVLGNHEEAVLSPACGPLRASGTVRPESLEYLVGLPKIMEMEIGGKRLVLMHTSPLDPTNDHAFKPADHPSDLPELKADILVVGNTHRPMITTVWNNTLLINPGAMGDSREADPWQRTFATLDTDTWEAYIHRFEDPAASRRRNNGHFH